MDGSLLEALIWEMSRRKTRSEAGARGGSLVMRETTAGYHLDDVQRAVRLRFEGVTGGQDEHMPTES